MNEGSLWPGDKDFEFEAFPWILAAFPGQMCAGQQQKTLIFLLLVHVFF